MKKLFSKLGQLFKPGSGDESAGQATPSADDVAIIAYIPSPGDDEDGFGISDVEDPIAEMLQKGGLGYLDGHGFDLESSSAEIFFYAYRERKDVAVKLICGMLQRMQMPQGTRIQVQDGDDVTESPLYSVET